MIFMIASGYASLRLMGALITAAASLFCAALVTSFYRKRASQLRELHRFVEFIALKIDCSCDGFDKIYSEFDFNPSCRDFSQTLLSSGWEEAVNCSLLLTGSVCAALTRFGAGLGRSGSKSQLKLCDETLALLQTELKRDEDGLDGRIKTAASLIISSGLTLSLIVM